MEKVDTELSENITSVTYGTDFKTGLTGIISFTISRRSDGTIKSASKLGDECHKQWAKWRKEGKLAEIVDDATEKVAEVEAAVDIPEEEVEEKPKKRRGRPAGSKNKSKTAVVEEEKPEEVKNESEDLDEFDDEVDDEVDAAPEVTDDEAVEDEFDDDNEVVDDVEGEDSDVEVDDLDEIDEDFDGENDNVDEDDELEDDEGDSVKDWYECSQKELVAECKKRNIKKTIKGDPIANASKSNLILALEEHMEQADDEL